MSTAVVSDAGARGGPREFSDVYKRVVAANAAGATLAFVYLSFVSPPQPAPPHREGLLFLAVAPLYAVLAGVLTYRTGARAYAPIAQWSSAGRAATESERATTLAFPWVASGQAARAWLGAAVLFAVTTATHHPAIYVAGVAVGIVLAGLTSTAVTFLLVERALRSVFAAALAGETPAARRTLATRLLRTRPRLLIAWLLGSGIALAAIPLAFLGRGDARGDELLGAVLFLVVVGLFAGGAVTAAVARSVSEPIERLRGAVARVETGSLDEQVEVDDGGEIGLLQAGFNEMVAGLRERERMRDALGAYVDRDVAERILREGTSLRGEEVEVTILFLDIRGFTQLAERTSAPELVATLNHLFELVVPAIVAHGGHVNKYVGDGLIAVFGAPRRQTDHADRALSAAQEISEAVSAAFAGDLHIGIGLNSGRVVAGSVGGAGRLEFTVIGDAVNVAARVESATRQTGDTVLLAERTRELLTGAVPLDERPGVELKGKSSPVSLYAPRLGSAQRVATPGT